MKISQQLKQQQHLSIEVFPPKGELKIESLHDILNGMKELKPDFISVTCSAGGSGNSANTAEMAGIIKNDYNIESCAHFTCINSDINSVQTQIAELKQRGIENVLALRGDLVDGKQPRDFHYAKDIIPLLRNEGFCVGAACYPEGHIECVDLDRDIRFLREKQDVGAEFFLSQLFFDNEAYYKFLDRAEKAGIDRPLIPGIMPFMGKSQISRMIFLCGSSLPSGVIKLLYKYEHDAEGLRRAGIEYAAEQINDLRSQGIYSLHLYAMNQPQVSRDVLALLK